MKRIAFIGTVNSRERSSQLFNLYNESRIYNAEHNIKGIFLVYKNIVLQILEGDSENVGKAVYYARRGGKFETFGVLINEEVGTPYFNKWPMRFVKNDSPSHDAFLKKLKYALADRISFNSEQEQRLYESIFQDRGRVAPLDSVRPQSAVMDKPPAPVSAPGGYAGTALSLSSWPKPTQVRNTPQVIKTCSLLSRGFVRYEDLLGKGIWARESDLTDFLNTLNQWGLLLIEGEQKAGNVSAVKSGGDRFSQLLKKFIQSPKHQAS